MEVCAHCDLQTIRSALHKAQDGDLILVKAGEYKEETLTITKSISLIGETGATIFHLGEGDTILIQAPNTTVKGFKTVGSGKSTYHDYASIKVSNTSGCLIADNQIVDSQYGIMIANSSACSVSGNNITTNSVPAGLLGDGIHLWKTTHMRLTKNTVHGHRDGIYLEFTEAGEIFDNTIRGNQRYGLHFMFSNDNTFRNNTFSGNDAGVAVMYSKRVKMLNNEYADNKGSASFGLLLKDISDSEIVGNEFLRNTVAIFMEGSNRNNIHSNRFDKNGWAIRLLSSCDSNLFQGNAFLDNTLEVATNSQTNLNTFKGNYWAHHQNVDLNQDGIVDLPYQPTSFSSYLLEKYNLSILLVGTPILKFLDWAEQMFPAISPVSLRDPEPLMPHLSRGNK
ncbi:MAG: hypothetical protein OM95_02380 [Bdellovibrio sp. ArHS]|nr:MAG: hypothetical protein OM95_02380 [Bdellovibrio sp. ArHS]